MPELMTTVSIEAEQSVIGAVLLDARITDSVCEKIGADDFYQAQHRDIFRSVLEMRATNQAVDPISLCAHMQQRDRKADLAYIMEMMVNTPGTTNANTYAGIVLDRSKKRQLQMALDSSSRQIAEDGTADADDLTARAAALIGSLQCADGQGLRNTKQIIKSLAEKWDKRSALGGEVDGLETGLKELDRRFMGWKPGNLIVIGGRPSMGKSVLAFQIGLHNAANKSKRVLGFSLEMTGEELLQRSTANLGSIHLDVFRKCDKNDFGVNQHAIMSAATRLGNADLLIDDTPQLHINQIMARARNAHRKKALDLVIVDHINIARGDGQSREREVASITGGLKALAKELGCPVIAVTQLNRSVEQTSDKKPNMSHLRDSGSIEQDADIVILLYRKEYYEPDTTEKGIIEIITGKFREGETGIDHCASLLHMSKITDLAYEYKAPQENNQNRRGFK